MSNTKEKPIKTTTIRGTKLGDTTTIVVGLDGNVRVVKGQC